MLIGFVTEDWQEFISLAAGRHTHILHTDRKETSPDCDDVSRISEMHEIKPHFDQQSYSISYPVATFNLPSSCSNCRSCNENECPYLSIQNRKQCTMKIKNFHVNADSELLTINVSVLTTPPIK